MATNQNCSTRRGTSACNIPVLSSQHPTTVWATVIRNPADQSYLTPPTLHHARRWEDDRPGLKELIGALSETRDLMRREIKARTDALASGGAAAQAVGAGVTTGFNVIQVLLLSKFMLSGSAQRERDRRPP
jgi:hypothetical protein